MQQYCTHSKPFSLAMSPPDPQPAPAPGSPLRLLKSGLAAYLTKERAPEELILAAKIILAGGKYVSPMLAARSHSPASPARPPHRRARPAHRNRYGRISAADDLAALPSIIAASVGAKHPAAEPPPQPPLIAGCFALLTRPLLHPAYRVASSFALPARSNLPPASFQAYYLQRLADMRLLGSVFLPGSGDGIHR